MEILVPERPDGPPLATLRAGYARLRPLAWLAFLVIGLGVAFGGAIVGDEVAFAPLLAVLGLTGPIAITMGVRANHPGRRLPWQMIAACVALTTIGISILPATGPFAIVAQTVTGVGYVLGFWGFIILIRGRIPGGERGPFLDAAILAAQAALSATSPA